MNKLRLLIVATVFAAVTTAATINFTGTSTTLPGGEVVTVGPGSAVFSSLPAALNLAVSADTTVNGSGLTNFVIDVPWDVDGIAALLHVTGTYTPGSTWNIRSLHWDQATLPSPDLTFGYPVRINLGGDVGAVVFTGTLGGTGDGNMRINLSLGNTPEPATFGLVGLALMAVAATRRKAGK